MNQPIFLVETDLDYEYVDLLNDVIKYITVILVVHAFLTYQNGGKAVLKLGTLLSNDFMDLLVYIILGFMTYNLIIRKLVVFQ